MRSLCQTLFQMRSFLIKLPNNTQKMVTNEHPHFIYRLILHTATLSNTQTTSLDIRIKLIRSVFN